MYVLYDCHFNLVKARLSELKKEENNQSQCPFPTYKFSDNQVYIRW